mmetsp:Transcript_33792/g.73232  ORF Transcript_33792/g.73232 Transcript_33792/m.73232 type:complete len:144 (+) Transcript_33792:65-496(+)
MFSLLYGYVTGGGYGSDGESPTQAERRETNASCRSAPSSHALLRDFSSSRRSPNDENRYYHGQSAQCTVPLSDVSNVSTPTVHVRTNDQGKKPLHDVGSEALSAPASWAMPPSQATYAVLSSSSTKARNSSSCRRRHHRTALQ